MSDIEEDEFCLTGRDNWGVWKFLIQIIFEERDLLDHLRETDIEDKMNEKEFLEKDKQAKDIIVTRIGSEPIGHIISCNTAVEMWRKLVSVYDYKPNNKTKSGNEEELATYLRNKLKLDEQERRRRIEERKLKQIIICSICKKTGHVREECKFRFDYESKRCFNCHKRGHTSKWCKIRKDLMREKEVE